jgi:hypothetical protein
MGPRAGPWRAGSCASAAVRGAPAAAGDAGSVATWLPIANESGGIPRPVRVSPSTAGARYFGHEGRAPVII